MTRTVKLGVTPDRYPRPLSRRGDPEKICQAQRSGLFIAPRPRCYRYRLLAGACALLPGPQPAGTIAVQARITNNTPEEIPLAVTTPTQGEIPGAVRPPTSLPNSMTNVTLFLPASGDWAIFFPPENEFCRERIGDLVERGCLLLVEIETDSIGIDC